MRDSIVPPLLLFQHYRKILIAAGHSPAASMATVLDVSKLILWQALRVKKTAFAIDLLTNLSYIGLGGFVTRKGCICLLYTSDAADE